MIKYNLINKIHKQINDHKYELVNFKRILSEDDGGDGGQNDGRETDGGETDGG